MDQELDLEPVGEGAAIEIGSPLWQKLFAAPIILVICGCGVMGWIGAVCPQLLEHRPREMPDVWMRVFFFFCGPMMFGLGLYLSQPWFYRLRADAHGLTESLAWKERRVFWSDVASYSMEPQRQLFEARRYFEPVLRDAQGAILFRPALSLLASGESLVGRHDEFYRFVQSHLPGKETPYVSPPPVPSIYDGKSTAWKIKRVSLILLSILAFAGLWSAAMLWAIARTELPRWVLATIGSAALWVPLGAANAANFLAWLRRKRAANLQVLEPPDFG